MEIIFGFAGGLALFIFGMNEMGSGLQKVAVNKMRNILGALTSIPIVGVLVGTLVTAIIQSSSATTVMVVGFVNAGLLTLKQALSVIMGANIGTTVTAQLVSFNLMEYYLPMIALGFFLYFACKKKGLKSGGQILFSFGILFMGLAIMSNAMAPLAEYEGFRYLMATFGEYKILGLLCGILLTAVIQSSSAATGILIAMATQGLVTIEMALPILLGFNIGTCITAVLASIGTKLAAKRAAASHVLFNVIGAIIFLCILPLYQDAVVAISPGANVARQIANAHTLFNVVNTIILLPFINVIVKLVTKLLPGEERIMKKGPIYLDNHMLEKPAIAMTLVLREVLRMGELSRENLSNSMEFLRTRNPEIRADILNTEDVVDELEKAVSSYLIKLPEDGLSEEQINLKGRYFHIVNDMERVSDHANNIRGLTDTAIEENVKFSDQAMAELEEMYQLVDKNFAMAMESLEKNDPTLAAKAELDEERIDNMERTLRKSHIKRLNEGKCSTDAGVLYLDIISIFERVGDHANNITDVVLGKE